MFRRQLNCRRNDFCFLALAVATSITFSASLFIHHGGFAALGACYAIADLHFEISITLTRFPALAAWSTSKVAKGRSSRAATAT